jgi:hypothetical protein
MLDAVQAIDKTNPSLVQLDALSQPAAAALYGSYAIEPPGPLAVSTREDDNVCRRISVSDLKTTWKGTSGATIAVAHKGNAFTHQLSNTSSDIAGFRQNESTLCRRALGALTVTEFTASAASARSAPAASTASTASAASGASWTLVAAHRINYRYASKWSDNWLDNADLARLKERGLATGKLYDRTGLVWFLLLRSGGSFAMCTGYLPAYFADRVYGNLPESYDICTATRHQPTCADKTSWLFDTSSDFSCTGAASLESTVRATIGTASWIADKFAAPISPFFKDASGAVTEVVAAALASNLAKPLASLLDDMRYAYFGIVGPTGAKGPAGPPRGPPGLEGPPGAEGLEGPTGADGPTGTDGPMGPEGLEGTEAPEGPSGLAPWAIALIVIACILLVLAPAAFIYIKKQRSDRPYGREALAPKWLRRGRRA